MAAENLSKSPVAAGPPLEGSKNLALGSVSCPKLGYGRAWYPAQAVLLRPVRYWGTSSGYAEEKQVSPDKLHVVLLPTTSRQPQILWPWKCLSSLETSLCLASF